MYFKQRQEADIAPSGVASSIVVYERVDQSIPWLIQPFRMIVPWPEEQNNNDLMAAIRPFNSMVSFFIIILILDDP